MKNAKKLLLFLLATVIMLSASFTAFAKEAPLPKWSYFISIMGDMEVQNNGKATIMVDVIANRDKVDEIKTVCRLQQLQNGGWKTIKSWSENSNNVDHASVAYEKTYYIEKGYSYRIQLNSKAYVNGAVKENITSNFDYGYFH